MRTPFARVQSIFESGGRRSAIAGFALIFALIIACMGSVQVYKLAIPEHVERDTINITESDYKQALARWRTRGVAEYTIAIATRKDSITLRVVPAANEVYLLEHLREGEEYEPPNPDFPQSVDRYREYTVNGMFAAVQERLDLMMGGRRLEKSVADTDYYRDYIVQLDTTLGYPTRLEVNVRGTHETREITWREKKEPDVEVKRLTIVR